MIAFASCSKSAWPLGIKLTVLFAFALLIGLAQKECVTQGCGEVIAYAVAVAAQT